MPSLNPTAAAWPEPTRSFPKTGKRGAPQAFAHKLVQLLADEPDDIVAWSEDGTAFLIIDMRRFVNEVLPRHFSAAKFSSFQRQLNLYHFTTITPPADEASSIAKTYLHEHFLRDRPDLLSSVRRLPQANRGTRSYAPRASADGGRRRATAPSRRQAARSSDDDDDASSDDEYRPTNGGARSSGATRVSSTRTRKISARFAADAPSSSSSEESSDDDAGVTAATMSSSSRGPVRKKVRSVSAPPAANEPMTAPSAAVVAAVRFSSKLAHGAAATAVASGTPHTHNRSLSAPPGAPAALTFEDEARVAIELSQLDLDHELGLEECAVEEGFCYQFRRIVEEGDDDDDDADDDDDDVDAADDDAGDDEQRPIAIDGPGAAHAIDDDALLAAAADAVLGIDCEDAVDASSAMPPPPPAAWPRGCGSSARRQSSVGSECAMLRGASVGSEHWSSIAMLEEGEGADGSIAGGSPPALTDLATVFAPRTTMTAARRQSSVGSECAMLRSASVGSEHWSSIAMLEEGDGADGSIVDCGEEAAAAIAIAMVLGSPPALTNLATVFAPRTTTAAVFAAPALVAVC